jgi:D-alanyl-lipoteichoic acid acyltransferase DltB (MBOAT superfamily)
MSILQITFAGLGSLLFRFIDKDKHKENAILVANAFFLFLLQPTTSLRSLNIILPCSTIFIILAVGIAVSVKIERKEIFQVCLLSIMGFLPFLLSEFVPNLKTSILDKNINQSILSILLLVYSCLLVVLYFLRKKEQYLSFFLILILIIFIVLKQPQISYLASKGWRDLFQQNVEFASTLDIRWIGYSYIAFRMIHVIREYQKQRFNEISLIRFMNFCLFFPTLTAGPIAKYDDFTDQMEKPVNSAQSSLLEGGERLFSGLFKKFILADSLAVVALSPSHAQQITSSGWMWLALIFYSFQIFFDFSGYTDIAIGLGLFLGIKLPENFNKPYLKNNLTKFWDSWHMTLSQWIRAYFFNPVNRALRKSKFSKSQNFIVFITQVSTMAIIGLWHGITWTFLFWGLWHGIGLFLQNRWSAFIKNKFNKIRENCILDQIVNTLSTFLTFLYVSLGWVWFLSPTVEDAFNIFLKLFGKGFK